MIHVSCSTQASYKLARTLACSFRSLNFDLFTGGLPLSASRDDPPLPNIYMQVHVILFYTFTTYAYVWSVDNIPYFPAIKCMRLYFHMKKKRAQ